MRFWTVISCGDGEVYSAWVTQELAWESAQNLAEKINERVGKQTLKGIYEQTRVRVTTKGYEIVVETLRRVDHCSPIPDTQPWGRHSTIRVSSAEVKGDVVSALAKLGRTVAC